jgi:hypothetical protein
MNTVTLQIKHGASSGVTRGKCTRRSNSRPRSGGITRSRVAE